MPTTIITLVRRHGEKPIADAEAFGMMHHSWDECLSRPLIIPRERLGARHLF